MSPVELDEIPSVGLGTWKNTDPETCRSSVRTGIEIGYRHIDTAQLYENEQFVGEALQNQTTCERDQLFVSSKVDFNHLTYDEVINSTHESLQKLNLDRIDLMYVHWPAGEYEAKKTLEAFRKLKENGYIRHIGVSNYTIPLVREARDVLGDHLYAHQVEFHPLLQQEKIHKDALDHETYMVAYSPFRHGTIFDLDEVKSIAKGKDATTAQVILAWILQKENVIAIPKATGRKHLEENFRSLQLTLDESDVNKINSIGRRDRYINPPFAPDWD